MRNNARATLRSYRAAIMYGAAIALIIIPLALSCKLMDLSGLDVTLYPRERSSVIAGNEPVWIEFSEPVKREDAEGAASLESFSGSVAYDVSWEGNRMTLTPTEGWKAGASYALACKGAVKTADGRSFSVSASVAFYAIARSAPPELIAQDPANDAIVSPGAKVTLTFSKPLNPESVSRYVTTSPSASFTATLSPSGTVLTIAPEPAWEGLTRYQWTIKTELTDSSGIPIREECRGYFRVQEDTAPPERPEAFAVDPESAAVTLPLSAMKKKSGILFRFAEAIDSVSFAHQLAVSPDVPLTVRAIDGATFVAYPADSAWDSGTAYRVTVKKGLADAAGNLTTADFLWDFTPSFAALELISITNSPAGPNAVFEGLELESPDPLPIGVNAGPYLHDFIIRFSEPLSATEAERLIAATSLDAVFPLSVGSPSLVSSHLNPDGSVFLRYYDLTLPAVANSGERVIYKLTVEGGSTGFSLDSGSRMESDIALYLESVAP